MATGLNRVTLIGNLGKDPEIRYTPSGAAVGTLRLGVTEPKKEGEEYKDHTEWMNVVVFGKTAENASKFLQKGRQVYVDGRLQTRSWEDKNTNQTRYVTEVVANRLIFLGSKDGGAGSFSRPESKVEPESQGGGGFIEDDEIPF